MLQISTLLSNIQVGRNTTRESSDRPPETDHTSNDVNPQETTQDSEYFSAFRTITSLLSILQQKSMELVDVGSNLQERELYELEVLNALAMIMVVNHEVIAVTIEPSNMTFQYTDRTLNLIAACHQSLQGSQPAPDTSPSLMNHIRRFLVSLNTSRSPLIPPQTTDTSTPGVILGVEAPGGLQPDDFTGLLAYIQQDAHM